MAEPAVHVHLRPHAVPARELEQTAAEIAALVSRPVVDFAALRRLVLAPGTPGVPSRDRERVVKRAKPTRSRNRIESSFLTEATRELFERLGEGERRVIDGTVIFRWDLGEGDGIVVARKSSEETHGGETIGGQIAAMMEYCDARGMTPRIVVAVLNMSGQKHFESRHDFGEVFEAHFQGHASWVVYRDVHRIARAMEWLSLFVYYLRERDMHLHITGLSTEFTLHDRSQLVSFWIHAIYAELDWATTTTKLQTASARQLLDAGKGWSNSGGYGFTRDARGYVVVNGEVWPNIHLVHLLCGSTRSYVHLREVLAAEYGVVLSQGLISRILNDRVYVTGEFSTKDIRTGGMRTDVIQIKDPIPEDLWQHNQRVIAARRGKQVHAKPGEFVLREIPVYHARCSDHGGADAGRLIVRLSKERQPLLAHKATHLGDDGKLHVPPTCAGYRLPVATVEAAVMAALRELVKDDASLRRAMARAQLPIDDQPDGTLLTDAQRRQMGRAIGRLRRHHDANLAGTRRPDQQGRADPPLLHGGDQALAGEWMRHDLLLDELRWLAAHHPKGRLLSRTGEGRDRWNARALDRGLRQVAATTQWLTARGLTIDAAVRDAIGDRAALLNGRINVTCRDDAVLILAEVLREGFRFGPGWTVPYECFRRSSDFAPSYSHLHDWARRFEGDRRRLEPLLRDAGRLAGVEALPAGGLSAPTGRDLIIRELRARSATAAMLRRSTGKGRATVLQALRVLLETRVVASFDAPSNSHRRTVPWYRLIDAPNHDEAAEHVEDGRAGWVRSIAWLCAAAGSRREDRVSGTGARDQIDLSSEVNRSRCSLRFYGAGACSAVTATTCRRPSSLSSPTCHRG
ncbi:MAG: recombinase family protein [Actinobacteria bacterium]|nr:recombinase family protein [Actinomycetota bacterium]